MVTTAPYEATTYTAFDYAETALNLGYTIVGIFFYQSGSLNAFTAITTPSDELNMTARWQSLATKHNTGLHLCITAGEKRGIDPDNSSSVAEHFILSGLGEMVSLANDADTLVQF